MNHARLMGRRQALHSACAMAAAYLGGAALGTPTLALASPTSGATVKWPQVQLLDGGQFGPAQAQGKHVIVVFWATFCPFCLRHNAHIEKLRQAVVGRPIEILTVAQDRQAQAVRDYMQKNRYGFAVTLDHTAMAAALSARKVIPLTYVVGPNSRVVQTIPGEMFEEDVMEWRALG